MRAEDLRNVLGVRTFVVGLFDYRTDRNSGPGMDVSRAWTVSHSPYWRPHVRRYGVIFSMLYYYGRHVPSTSAWPIFGFFLRDKFWVYMLALQVAARQKCATDSSQFLSAGSFASVTSAASGLLAGIAYDSNLFGMQQWRLPVSIGVGCAKAARLRIDDGFPATAPLRR